MDKVLSELVVCPACAKKAMAKANFETKIVRLFCVHCGYIKKFQQL